MMGRFGGPSLGGAAVSVGADSPGILPGDQPQLPELPQMKSAGMFGQGGVGRNIAGLIGDFLMQRAGMNPIYSQTMMLKQRQAMEEQQYQRQRQDHRDDFTFEQDYRAAHDTPPTTEYERALAAAGIQPGTPQYMDHMKNFVNIRENPPHYQYVDGMGLVMVGGGQAPSAGPTAAPKPLTDDDIDKMGGPGLGGPGGFLR